MTVQDIIEKRKKRWEEKHDLEYDRLIVETGVETILENEALRQEVVNKPYLLIECAFTVVDKNKETVPFFLNDVQKDFIKRLEDRTENKPFFVLKGRQLGFTTLISAIQLCFAIVRKNFSGFTLSHRDDSTRSIFNDKARVVYAMLPDILKPHEKFNSAYEMVFDKLNSSWRIATVSADVGRSMTLNFVHFSEIAFYQIPLANLQKGIGEAITAGAIVVYETTANGFNDAKDLWDSGSCINLFYEWWRASEYTTTEYQYLDYQDDWLEKRKEWLFSIGLNDEQVAWYCKKYASYLIKETIKQEYPCTPLEAFISSGECIFDKEAIYSQILALQDTKYAKGIFEYDKVLKPIQNSLGDVVEYETTLTNIRFVERDDGYITIHKLPEIKTDEEDYTIGKAPYVIGGDTAGEGSDFYTAKCINNRTGQTVATLRKQIIDEDIYAEQLYCLGNLYNNALIGIETNYSRVPMRCLMDMNYPNLYRRERVDLQGKIENVFGFETTKKTKPVIIFELVKILRQEPQLEVDIETLKELSTFVRSDSGSLGAQVGCHDDLVMALAITHFVSNQQTKCWLEEEKELDFIEKNFGIEKNKSKYASWEND